MYLNTLIDADLPEKAENVEILGDGKVETDQNQVQYVYLSDFFFLPR